MAQSISALGVNMAETMTYSSPFYRIALSLMGRILSQNASLYADMQMYNPYAPKILQSLIESLKDFKTVVESGRKHDFIRQFEESRKFFGVGVVKEASDFFTKLIQYEADLVSPIEQEIPRTRVL